MATIDLGKVALVWKGTYAAGTTYESKDVVQFTDSGEVSSYIYVNASGASGQTPSTGGTVNTTYWNKMAGGAAGIWASGLALGTAGQVVKVNTGASALEFGDAGGGLQSIQSFTSSGTYTKPAGINKIKVYVTGAGGGGGSSGTPSNAGGGGGCSGGTAIEILDATSITTVSVTIGSGGAGGTSGKGGNGGTSSFGSYCSATGGQGGNRGGAIGDERVPGVGSGGDVNLKGTAGIDGHDNANFADTGRSGAPSIWGGGGFGGHQRVGSAGEKGSGGGGGGEHSGSVNGGAGGDGFVYIEEYK
jgi:hypothetical protein